MMERFLDRLSNSKYKNNFIIKGGILISSMIGISLRTTMDIDVNIKNINLNKIEIERIVKEICSIEIDQILFSITNVEDIMNEANYSGVRISLVAKLDNIIVPLSIDVSTGEIITPREIEYNYPLLLEERTIELFVYNIETILSEKLQTIISRGILNTRMRDYYDIYILLVKYKDSINKNTMKNAFLNTCNNREIVISHDYMEEVLIQLRNDENIRELWERYQNKYIYAKNIEFEQCLDSIYELISLV